MIRCDEAKVVKGYISSRVRKYTKNTQKYKNVKIQTFKIRCDEANVVKRYVGSRVGKYTKKHTKVSS